MKDKFYDGDGPVGKYIRDNYYPDYNYKGVVMEVGGGHPYHYSFSKHFIDNGWRGIIFEPNPRYAKMHQELGHEIYQNAVSNKDEENVDFQVLTRFGDFQMSGSALSIKYENEITADAKVETIKVDVITLNTFFKEMNLINIDILSVDTEGWELEVMEGLDTSQFKARIVVLENLKYSPKYTQLMAKKGYRLVKMVTFNYIYEYIIK